VAYIDSSNGSTNVTLYDLQTGQKNQIRTGISYKQSPALTDQRLVWAELREGAGSGVTATSGYFDEVWGYVTKGSGIYDIWMYNIGDGSTTRIVESGSNKAQPYLYGNLMDYVDTGKGNPDIKLLDFSNNTTTNITTADSYDAQPTMGYGYLSWNPSAEIWAT
jgi:Tol biopolymer transport system component